MRLNERTEKELLKFDESFRVTFSIGLNFLIEYFELQNVREIDFSFIVFIPFQYT